MRSGKRRASKPADRKNPAYDTKRASPDSRNQRLVPNVDYALMTRSEMLELSARRQQRWRSWKDPANLPDFLLNSPDFQNQQAIRAGRRSRTEAPPVNVNLNKGPTPSPLHSRILTPPTRGSEKNHKQTSALECVGRKIKQQLVFAFGGGGSQRTYPDRKPPSKVKC